LKAYLLNNGIKTEIHYPIAPNHQEAMKDLIGHENYPISELIHQTTLSLPISYFHTENDVNQVVEIMNKF
jgi:dTDP-4-amino-4,6-dideoxygalactose transaminase